MRELVQQIDPLRKLNFQPEKQPQFGIKMTIKI
jgi:hypothetical protein